MTAEGGAGVVEVGVVEEEEATTLDLATLMEVIISTGEPAHKS